MTVSKMGALEKAATEKQAAVVSFETELTQHREELIAEKTAALEAAAADKHVAVSVHVEDKEGVKREALAAIESHRQQLFQQKKCAVAEVQRAA